MFFFDEISSNIYENVCGDFLTVAQALEKTERLFNLKE